MASKPSNEFSGPLSGDPATSKPTATSTAPTCDRTDALPDAATHDGAGNDGAARNDGTARYDATKPIWRWNVWNYASWRFSNGSLLHGL